MSSGWVASIGRAAAKAALVLTALLLLAGSAVATGAAAAPGAPARWTVQAGPVFGGILEGVTATSASNAWAVGFTATPSSLVGRPVIEHWDGTRWRRQATPRLPEGSALAAVAASSSRDAWAVGSTGSRVLIEHWNGGAWRVVREKTTGHLAGLTVISARDAWAVGNGTGGKALIVRWNGTTWRRVAAPKLSADASLIGVTATSATSAWAVGETGPNGFSGHVLIEHWNGRAWQRQAAPRLPIGALTGIDVAGPGDVWAVGETRNTRTLTLHWNGRSWRHVPSPCTKGCQLTSVAAISGGMGGRRRDPRRSRHLALERARLAAGAWPQPECHQNG